MNYSQALAWLYGTQLTGIKLGLQQIRRLLDESGFSAESLRFIHVAGTNGKGSVCAMIDSICRAQGIRTGLYTSPHLVSFRERIRVDGRMISEDEVAAGLSKLRQITDGWESHPTFFEITTALALLHFQHAKADIVVLETGLGGRLDSTNVVTPLVSVLTSIDMDHQAWLGSTLGQIAGEKAGIIKPAIPVVSAPQHDEAREVISRTATERSSPLEIVTEPLEGFSIRLAGSHQKLNAAIAVASLRTAGIDVSAEAVRNGLENVEWPGRFQIVKHSKATPQNAIILDGAHNQAATQRLVMTWREVFGDERTVVVLGILKDKDMHAICKALLPIASAFVTTSVRNQRTAEALELQKIIHDLDPAAECFVSSDFPDALEKAATKTGKILITGSLFLVGEALAFLEANGTQAEIGLQ